MHTPISFIGTDRAEVIVSIQIQQYRSLFSQGMGASIHAIENPILVTENRSWGGSVWGANPAPDDQEAWDKVLQYAKWLGLDWTRLEVEQRMYNPEKGVFTWNNDEMRILYRYLDWCEVNGVDVLLQQMWSNTRWMAYPTHRHSAEGILSSASYDKVQFAESYATLIEYLTNNRKYTCIKWLNFSNEPGESWSWWQSPDDIEVPEDISPAFYLVREALDAKGIAIPLLGPDQTHAPGILPEKVSFTEVLGGFDMHSYVAKFDWWKDTAQTKDFPTLQSTLEDVKRWVAMARKQQKPFLITEYGTFLYGYRKNTPLVSCREAVVKDAQLVIRCLNAGVNGFNKWSFLNRGDLDGQWQLVDTWDVEKQELLPATEIKPHENSFNAFALLSRFTPKQSKVLDVSVVGGNDGVCQRVFATALETPSGDYTFILTNDNDFPYTLSLHLSLPLEKELFVYRLDDMSGQLALVNQQITLNPKDIVTLTTFKMTDTDAGKIG